MTEEKHGQSGLVKWDLGAGNPNEGESRPEGWLFQDVDISIDGIDLVCDLREIGNHLEPNSVDEFRISHCLEHFTITESDKLLRTLRKILKVQGKLTIIVPNFRWHAELLLSGHEEEANYYCFGGQKDDFDLHKQGWTKNRLIKALQQAGYALLSCDDESSITCVALKI